MIFELLTLSAVIIILFFNELAVKKFDIIIRRKVKLLTLFALMLTFLIPFAGVAQGTLTGTVTSNGKALDNTSVSAFVTP